LNNTQINEHTGDFIFHVGAVVAVIVW